MRSSPLISLLLLLLFTYSQFFKLEINVISCAQQLVTQLIQQLNTTFSITSYNTFQLVFQYKLTHLLSSSLVTTTSDSLTLTSCLL